MTLAKTKPKSEKRKSEYRIQSERFRNAVLAGLRMLERGILADDVPADIERIHTDDGETEPMSPDEIDALCEEINTRGIEI